MQDLVENATIIYKNGLKKIFDAISVTEKGVYTGEIKSLNENREGFIHHSYIPKNQIQKIMVVNEKGKIQRLPLIQQFPSPASVHIFPLFFSSFFSSCITIF